MAGVHRHEVIPVPGAVDIDVEWAREALRDVNLKQADPDLKSI